MYALIVNAGAAKHCRKIEIIKRACVHVQGKDKEGGWLWGAAATCSFLCLLANSVTNISLARFSRFSCRTCVRRSAKIPPSQPAQHLRTRTRAYAELSCRSTCTTWMIRRERSRSASTASRSTMAW